MICSLVKHEWSFEGELFSDKKQCLFTLLKREGLTSTATLDQHHPCHDSPGVIIGPDQPNEDGSTNGHCIDIYLDR